jgi:hypothetical protein
MPFLFIHGVNVRDEKATINDAQVLAKALAQYVVQPLADAKVGRFAAIQVAPKPMMFVPYWGDVGVRFRWNLASLPKVRLTNVLGSEQIKPGDPMPGQAEALAAILEAAGTDPGGSNLLLAAARYDLRGFLRVIFAPTVYAGQPLVDDAQAGLSVSREPLSEESPATTSPRSDPSRNADAVGPQGEVLLLEVLDSLAHDGEAGRIVAAASDDRELLNGIQGLVLEEFRRSVDAVTPLTNAQRMGGGNIGAWFNGAKARVGEFFARARNAPKRALTAGALTFKRESWNDDLTRFTGDVFEYLNRRGDKTAPGPIVRRVVDELNAARSLSPTEPWFVVTHSMGGNIFYDMLTYYRSELDVEVWLSVGGQVGLFEEMKLFHASDNSVKAPRTVPVSSTGVRCWLNVYDPVDPFAYLAEPVFGTSAVKDVEFSTGSGGKASHSAYFRQPSFFRKIASELRTVYRAGAK